MPYKNRSTPSFKDCLYHVYARGINKIPIFRDIEDRKVFLFLIKKYLTKDFKEKRYFNGVEIEVPVNSAYLFVELQAFCLMLTHFHFLIYCKEDKGISKFMTRILSNYTTYFNKKYKRQGQLFQGSYRAVPILNENQLITVGVYIHINPDKAGITLFKDFSSLDNYRYSKEYEWLKLNVSLVKDIDFLHLEKYLPRLDLTPEERESMGLL